MEIITEANKKSIREFAYEAFIHILAGKLSDAPEDRTQILINVINILNEKFNGKRQYFTKIIFQSMCVTQILLNEYFKRFFNLHFYNNFRGTFINDFKLILLNWLKKRDDVFVKIIDSLAIFTDAFLFCLDNEGFHSNIQNITEELINLFEEIFSSEFFHKGGWSRLNEKAEMWYQNLYLEYCIKEGVVDFCKLVSFLRKSTVMFPVPEYWLCEKCKTPQDESMTRQITYVIPDYYFLNSLDNKSIGVICTDLEKVSIEKQIEWVKSGDNFVENKKNTYVERKYSSDTGIEYVGAGNDLEKLLECEKDSVNIVKCLEVTNDNSTNGKIGTIDAGKIDVDNGKLSVDDRKHTAHDEKDPEGDEKDIESDKKDPEVEEVIHSTVAAVSKLYNSDSTLEMNQNLLEAFIGKARKTRRTKNNDFLFIAEKYSHSVEKMLKEVFSIQSANISKFSDIVKESKTSDYNIPNLDKIFFFSMAYVFVFIGGTKK